MLLWMHWRSVPEVASVRVMRHRRHGRLCLGWLLLASVGLLPPLSLTVAADPAQQAQVQLAVPAGESGLQQWAIVGDERIQEASGLAWSQLHRDACWIHNDSGDKPRLFLVNRDGSTRAVVTVADAEAYDWEDMCAFTRDGNAWLLVGDIGDNARRRGLPGQGGLPPCRLLLLRETPLPATGDKPAAVRWSVHSTLEFTWEGGPRDCESLAVDVRDNRILLVSKSQPLSCGLYHLPLRLEPGRQTAVARQLTSASIPFATAMDVSPAGDRMVIVTPLTGLLVTRQGTQSWADALSQNAQVLQLPPRRQGETVCFLPDGRSVLLNSEGVHQPLWHLTLPAPPN